MKAAPPLPIDDVLEALRAALSRGASAVLVAPPGAGKTTRVPLALLDEPWLGTAKILVLEPRRLAARGAAERMAQTLGETLGGTVGLRSRLQTKVSAKTLIEVITEGVFTRMILEDPSLEGVGAVLFDEYHERSLDADLGLALALDTQSALREDLRILVMSATLDGGRVAGLLNGAPVIESEGRAFPVETRYIGRDRGRRIEDAMTEAVLRALSAESGSILVFLPGQGEIRRVAQRLQETVTGTAVEICPLYGAMDMAAQDKAVRPAPPGARKVVLATSIAETSLTIEGVSVVIDCGLARVPRYEPDAGITRLETVRVSRAAADQRRGRAGRTAPGICLRLWDEPETQGLPAFARPEILDADLAGFLLDLAAWGVSDPLTLRFLDPPPAPALTEARALLIALGAVDAAGRMTARGKTLQQMPLAPRLANMVLAGAEQGEARGAAEIAALLSEHGLGGREIDVAQRLAGFRRDRTPRAEEMRRLASGWARHASASAAAQPAAGVDPGWLIALAFPERIAMARGAPGQFILANGRGAAMEPGEPLAGSRFIAVAELSGRAAATRILAAAALDEAALEALAGARITTADELSFDPRAGALRARRVRRLEAIVLSSETRAVPDDETAPRLLAEGAAALGIHRLAWTKPQQQLRDRAGFLRRAGETGLPDLSDAALAEHAAQWLAPYLAGKTSVAAIGAGTLDEALNALLPWRLQRLLETAAPTHFTAPSGQRHAISYEGEGAPMLAIRVQELFGLTAHPAIAGGKLPLTLQLLSPAHRPIQITRDLPGFWKGSWAAVKSEMRGRYPKHPWPDDPANAPPTHRAKPRGT